ncbi:MAG: hypothetical protein ACK5WC_02905 [Aphanizomenon sp.]|uniref:hypothetical protein n=1 Tax=Anabaena sp. AL09 TaxID=1710891 RepID=UPI001AF878A3|nr:hypothetical protein [Anabaena sp. AL09]QSV67146.1 MAG: hypothetical protein HEQ12_09450 [Aphanizomenon flos-aquae DEX188]
MSIILENKSIIPFLVEAIAISIQNIRNAIPTERFAIALKTHNTRKAIALITKNTGNAIAHTSNYFYRLNTSRW